jgi:hypothetical protein
VLHPLSGRGRSTRRFGREIDLDRRHGVNRAITESMTRQCRGTETMSQWGRYLTLHDGGRESTLQPSSIPAGDTPAGSMTSLDPVAESHSESVHDVILRASLTGGDLSFRKSCGAGCLRNVKQHRLMDSDLRSALREGAGVEQSTPIRLF